MITSNTFSEKKTFLEKIKSIDYILLAVILLIGIISCFAMYSTDDGQFRYHTTSHILKINQTILQKESNINQNNKEELLL